MEIHVEESVVYLLVGADPEVFAKKNGKLISAHGLVKGSKEHPHVVPNGAIQVDGMALEFNIDPSPTCDSFVKNILSVMKTLEDSLPQDVTLAVVPTAKFGSDYINSQPLIAKELGCSSDLNAYTGLDNEKPNASVPFRTAAGHVHIGWSEDMDINNQDHIDLCCDLTKVLDLYLGVPSVFMDSDVTRRSLYGAAGSLRVKSYGLEYRVLSNFWLKSEASIEWVYNQVALAIKVFLEGFRVSEYDEHVIVTSINNSNKASSKLLLESKGLLGERYGL